VTVVALCGLLSTPLACGGSAGSNGDAAPGDAFVAPDAASDGTANLQDGGVNGDGAHDDGAFGPPPTGYHFFFDLGAVLLMGQTTGLAVGGFMPTAREDLLPPRETPTPLGECVEAPAPPPPECVTSADCAPEQQCLPETDADGKPVPNTEHCVTPRSLMDVGPFTVSGFASGTLEFSYNAGQKGAYTTANPGDGQIPPDEIVYGGTYTITGTGDPSQGIGAFTGEVSMPPALALTEPAVVQLPMGLPGIEVSVSQDLTITWSEPDPTHEITVSLAGGGQGGKTIICRVQDTGSVTIPKSLVQAAGLGNLAFLNILTLERNRPGTASGEGLTFTRVTATQTLMYNVAKKP